MKTIPLLRHSLTVAVAGACLLVAGAANASETKTAFTANVLGTEMALDLLDNGKPKKEKIIKPKRRKHKRRQRTNHGPRKDLFPQVHRKGDPLSRFTFRDSYQH